MSELKALEVSLDEDLLSLSQYLWRHGLAHRIVELEGRRVLLVKQRDQIDPVRDLYARTRRGEVLPAQPKLPVQHNGLVIALLRFPVTMVLIALSCVGAVIGGLNLPSMHWFTFYDYDVLGNYLVFDLAQGQYWRLFTPMFLHFSLLHIAFNMVLLWFWGRKIEITQSGQRLFAVVLLLAMVSNIAQAIYSGPSRFGGMSGVDFGLFGYCLAWSWIFPKSVLQVERPLAIMMFVSLALGFVSFSDLLGMGATANIAHASGLIFGLLLGFGMALIAKARQ
ncbi:MAG TPA: rhomboid family intramembrane serine protease [Spongiibacteraceae bacterium]|jgi:GlpG protein